MMSTRKAVSLVLALAVSAAAATPVFAVTVSRADGKPMNPNGEPFSVSGTTSLTSPVANANCTATFNGTITSGGIVNITSTQFVAGDVLCGAIQGSATSNTPWTGQADTTTQLSINNVAVTAPFVSCGPTKVVGAWDNPSSSLTFNNASLDGGCTVTGTVTSSPAFSIAP